ncbi:clorobiocin biosynthesis protein Clo-hal [Thermosporothrix hazakensis]|jgi:clorobiocin biosynthesis protein Clo-hal|uniref:Clorobiocin biosynthesis protein Clo-hal n=2 Tax=Thermosporothrix TaxID=768650 RepID=A0A326UNL4_THEHA|nr:NAD(P)/FAD-dependent oxidoreductase [Thermosporothrix hazakensis]PZW31902.1 clorobiocin biosynthesis protein Clo-hal [Thermosporothrix hazakensis]BBH91629.1 FAD-binding protein [Thermosporothrix sp. COM3]GCE49773.1 FAD-binding protein [Thermosporothrix hazakensis]
MAEQFFDVAVVGGGPAGATCATLLAKKGHHVLLVEKEKFPRYHIGESTVPGVLPVFEELGIADEMKKHAFVKKRGITLVWGQGREPWDVDFADAGPLTGPYDHAYQVVRSEFDSILLANARHCGVTVLEDTTVVDFLFEDERCCGLKYTRSGKASTVRARFVVDASGQNTLLARRYNLLEWDEGLKNVAIWAYYQGGKTLPGRNAGNILVENMYDSWLWVIPLHDGTHSVGLVMPAENAGGKQALEQQFEETLENSVETKKLLVAAQRVSNYRTARDWSYKSQRFYGPGFLLTGDAAGFVDPLFSTGVFLALRGGSLASAAIDRLLKTPEREAEVLKRYEESYRDFFDVVISFVHYFYDASKEKEAYWHRAQELIDPIEQMTSRQDFIRLISGQAGIVDVMRLDTTEKVNL